MKCRRTNLAVQMVIWVSIMIFGSSSPAQQVEDLNHGPVMREGQMFVVRLTPGAKRLEFMVTGRQAAKLESTDLGLRATVRGPGGQRLILEPRREGQTFVIERPQKVTSPLELEVRYRKDSEKFEFPLQNVRP